MSSTLPSRWQEILRKEAVATVGSVLAQAKAQPQPKSVPRWAMPVLVIGVASVAMLSLVGRTDTRRPGGVPFDRSTVLSTKTAGLGATAEDLAPVARPAAPPTPSPAVEAAKPTSPPAAKAAGQATRSVQSARAPESRRVQPRCVDCEGERAARALAQDSTAADGADVPRKEPVAPPRPLVINVGSRLAAVLTDPVTTSGGLAPVTARLTTDVSVGDRMALPTGSILVGEAFATQENDRVQVVFTAVVKDGKTIPFEGLALQQDEMGVRGKVVRKGSKVKKGAGSVLGAAASALTFGLAGQTSGPAGAAISGLGSAAYSGLSGLGREWTPSNKGVRLEAGTAILVYLRRDVEVP